MKNKYKRIKANAQAVLLSALSLMFIVSCDDEINTPDPIPLTDQELIIDVLDGVWDIDLESSNIPNKSALGLETASANIDIDPDGNGVVSVAGDLASYVSGGSFAVDASGAIINPVIDVNSSSGLAADNATYTLSSDQSTLSIGFSVSSARVDGLGTWELVVNL